MQGLLPHFLQGKTQIFYTTRSDHGFCKAERPLDALLFLGCKKEIHVQTGSKSPAPFKHVRSCYVNSSNNERILGYKALKPPGCLIN